MDIDEAIKIVIKQYQAGNLKQAENLCRAILNYQPDNLFVVNYLANILQDQGKIDEAIVWYQKAIEFNPNDFGPYYNLADAFFEKGQTEQAILNYKKTLSLNPEFPWAYNNLGLVLKDLGKLDEAITYFKKAIQLSPKFALAFNNLGNALQYTGHLSDALACYEKALGINSKLSDAKWNIGLIQLTFGNFEKGWKHYEYRWETKESGSHKRDFFKPIWDGSSLKGKRLLIYAEQGVGDEIMFASCFPDAIEQADSCIIECDKRLVPIFSRSFPGTTIIERFNTDNNGAMALLSFDVVIAMGSLPLYLRNSLNNFPSRKSYLIPNAEKVDTWNKRFKALGEGTKIGISWRGGKDAFIKQIRSMVLTQWAEILSIPGSYFINLQYGDVRDELKQIQDELGITIYDWEDADPLKDLDNFAAEISSLDLVISIDNSTVHMAGALGVPVWTLLSFVHDWRWMLNRQDTPWYPTMRLFRQPSPGDWESVIAKVKDELLKLLGNN
ncbi:MAG: tetratricopeptide repeat protein [Nitrospira sp.]|nr:tetratricopeptide repeat protein [Nitrospira sp.]